MKIAIDVRQLPHIVALFFSGCLAGSAAEVGLVGKYYNGFKVTDGRIVFDGLELVKTQVDTNWDNWDGTASFNWDPIGGGNYSVQWTGCWNAPFAGTYGFGTISDDGSQIWIDGRLVLDNSEGQWYDWQEAYAYLGAGYHTIEIDYYDSGVYSGIEVWFLPPSVDASPLPYAGETFHSVPPTFNAGTKWSSIATQQLRTEPPAPIPQLQWGYSVTGQQLEFNWLGHSNVIYHVESSSDLVNWQTLEGPFPGNDELAARAIAVQKTNEFFRVVAAPAP
jgi:hypothetical protein